MPTRGRPPKPNQTIMDGQVKPLSSLSLSSRNVLIDPALQAEEETEKVVHLISSKLDKSVLNDPPKKRGRPPTLNKISKLDQRNNKKLKPTSSTHDLDKQQKSHTPQPKAFFSTKALRSTFNPLPIQDPLFQFTNSSSSIDQDSHLNPRSSNQLNQFKFKKPDWLSQILLSSSSPDRHRINRFLLMFGSGDMGQMGLGVEKLEDVKKPLIHHLIEALKSNSDLSLGPETVACGGMHTLLIDGNGHIWSWGINDNAALGRKTEGIESVEQEELESRPIRVQNLSDSGLQPFRAVRVEAGDSVSVAVSDQGELRAWGSFRSNDGLLGFDGKVGSTVKQLIPTRVANLSQYPVCQVVCGYDHVLALTTDGHVYSWGNGQQHQLGRKIIERRKQNGLTPERLSLKRIVLIGTGGSHSFAVNEKGDVFGWGLNTRGQLGISADDKSSQDEIVPIPTLISTMSPSQHNGARVVAIHGGDFHTLFLLNNGQVWSVGNYENGEIGLSKSSSQILEVERSRKEGSEKKQKFVKDQLIRRKDRFENDLKKFESKVKEAGDWTQEEINGARPRWEESVESMEIEQEAANLSFIPGQCIRTPTLITFPHPIVDISCGARHNLAVDVEGNAYSWGLGQSNELGLGRDEDGEDIELVEVPHKLASKALSPNGVNGLGQVKVLKCEAGGTHSVLIGVALLLTANGI